MSFISNGGSYEWKITNNGTTYGAENLSGGRLTDSLYKQIGIGNVIAKTLELTLYDVTIDPAYPLILTVEATDVGGTTTTIGKGTYFVDTIEKSPYSDYTQVIAYDAILKAEVPYMKTGTWTTTDDETIVTDIAQNVLGLAYPYLEADTATLLSTPMTIDQVPDIGDNGTSCREMLSVIAVMRGGNWIINDADELEFVPLTGRLDPHATVTVGDEVVNFDVSPSETITRVELWASSSASYRSPSGLTEAQWEALGGIVLSANMPIMASQQLADDLYATYNNFVYVPYNANETYVDVDIPLGTSLIIKNDTVVMSNRVTSISVLGSSDLFAGATQAQKSYYPYLSSSERALKKDVNAASARITVNESSIVQEVARATEVEGELQSSLLTVETTASEFGIWYGTSAAGEMQEAADTAVDAYKEEVKNYMNYDAANNVLTLGNTDSPFQAKLTPQQLSFTGDDGQDAAWISTNQLNINEAVIQQREMFVAKENDTVVGNWVQQVANKHFQIKWVGN